jgi:hypothetical protein
MIACAPVELVQVGTYGKGDAISLDQRVKPVVLNRMPEMIEVLALEKPRIPSLVLGRSFF